MSALDQSVRPSTRGDKERSAALVAEYALVPAVPVWPATLVLRRIDAPSFNRGRAFWMVKYADFDIDIEILALGAFRGLGKRRKLRHSGVHEKHINVSQLLRNLGGQFVHVRQLGHVPFHRHHTVSDGLHGFI